MTHPSDKRKEQLNAGAGFPVSVFVVEVIFFSFSV
jgi:hypothetical protein